ncbi:MAG: hypothetical protein RSC97_07635 [Eubacterium sp.]
MGQTLTASSTPSEATVTYQWKVADTATGAYSPISGATGKTHKLAADKLGKFIKVELTGQNGYTGVLLSDPTTAVIASA